MFLLPNEALRFSFHLLSKQKIHFTCRRSLRNCESLNDTESEWVKGCDTFNQLHAQLDSCAVLCTLFRFFPPFTACEGWKWKAMLLSSLSIYLTLSFILAGSVCICACQELYSTWRKLFACIPIHLNGICSAGTGVFIYIIWNIPSLLVDPQVCWQFLEPINWTSRNDIMTLLIKVIIMFLTWQCLRFVSDIQRRIMTSKGHYKLEPLYLLHYCCHCTDHSVNLTFHPSLNRELNTKILLHMR